MSSVIEKQTVGARPVVATTQGKVRGIVEDGCAVFRGIPYAEPPAGMLRFRPPARRRAWEGVREANRFGACHPQDIDPVEGKLMNQRLRPPRGEDCLNLNVWTPDLGATAMPVLVWIHGGSLKYGSGADAVYDGATFARDGVVTVTLNYRLHPGRLPPRRRSPRLGSVRSAGPDRGARVGAGEHRGVRRRPGHGHGGRRVGRRAQRRPAAGGTGGARAVSPGDPAERRGVLRRAGRGRAVVGDAVLGRLGRAPRRRRRDRQDLERGAAGGVARGRSARCSTLLDEHAVSPNLMSATAARHEPVDLWRAMRCPQRALRRDRRRRRLRHRSARRHDAGREAPVRAGLRGDRAAGCRRSRSNRRAGRARPCSTRTARRIGRATEQDVRRAS